MIYNLLNCINILEIGMEKVLTSDNGPQFFVSADTIFFFTQDIIIRKHLFKPAYFFVFESHLQNYPVKLTTPTTNQSGKLHCSSEQETRYNLILPWLRVQSVTRTTCRYL